MALHRGGRDKDRDPRSGRGRPERGSSRERGDSTLRSGHRGRLSLSQGAGDRRLDRLQQRVAEDQRFQVPVFGNDWLCPYCLDLLGADQFANARDPLEVIFRHTAEECARYQDGRGVVAEMFELHERRIELLLRESQEFNFFDAENRWICPYDLMVTPVFGNHPDGSEVPVEQRLIPTMNYLENCRAYLDDPYSYNTLQTLQKKYGAHLRIRKLSNQLRQNVMFRFANIAGVWVCPYCRRSIDGIFLRGDGSTPNATVQMAQHMLSGQCAGLQHKFTVSPTLDQMRALTQQINQQLRATMAPGMLPMQPAGLPDLPIVGGMPEMIGVSSRGPSVSGILPALGDANEMGFGSNPGFGAPISPPVPLGPPPAQTPQQMIIQQSPTPGGGLPPIAGLPRANQPIIMPPDAGQQRPSPGTGNPGQPMSPSQMGITPPPWQLPGAGYPPPTAMPGYLPAPGMPGYPGTPGAPGYPPPMGVVPQTKQTPRPGTPYPGTQTPAGGSGAGGQESLERMRLEEERAEMQRQMNIQRREMDDQKRRMDVERQRLERERQEAEKKRQAEQAVLRWETEQVTSAAEVQRRKMEEEINAHRERAEKLKSHMDEARGVQNNLLPTKAPNIPGWQNAFIYHPAEFISGDMFDIIKVDERHYGFLIGDVSGHGVEAGLLMSMCAKAFQMRGRQNVSPTAVMQQVNEDLFDNLSANNKRKFITCFYAVLDIQTGQMNYARAGQNFPIVWCPPGTSGGPKIVQLTAQGSPIGSIKGPRFAKTLEEGVVHLESGHVLLLYTDGVTEAPNPRGDQFEEERMVAYLKKSAHQSPTACLEAIYQGVLTFAEGKPNDDDVSMIFLRRD
ncbi:MAG TPA: SpoIIE family protein phosphatase [Planctomycetota bacterium]|nr:SpoIIE family protein phosphatase [Planctomycetota bacterium]